MHVLRHNVRATMTARPRWHVWRLLAALACAGLLSVSLASAGEDEYNLNPIYCHNHSAWDPLWWIYKCWLPDPPGDPM